MSPITRMTIAGSTLAVLLATSALPAAAQSAADLDRRLTIVERKLENAALGRMYNQIQRLQQEIQQLRGEVDLLHRQVQAMEDRQRDIYVDLDARLRKLETGAPGSGAPGIDTPPAIPPAGGATGTTPPATPPAGAPSSPPPSPQASPPAPDEQTAAPQTPPAPSAADAAAAEAAYQRAFDTLKAGSYDKAAAQFAAYLEQYPNSRYADNARYWLGESYYVVREFDQAIEHFQRVLDDYPQSSKRADALLKIGFIYYEQGKLDQSRATLQKVIEAYPESTVAGLARQRLEHMGQ